MLKTLLVKQLLHMVMKKFLLPTTKFSPLYLSPSLLSLSLNLFSGLSFNIEYSFKANDQKLFDLKYDVYSVNCKECSSKCINKYFFSD